MHGSFKLIEQVFLGNSLRDWLLAAAAFIAVYLVVPFIRGRIRARHARLQGADRPALELLGLLADRTSRLVLLSVALDLSEKVLRLPPKLDRTFDVIIVFGIAVQLALWAVTALRFAIDRHYRRQGGEDASAASSVGVLMFIGQLAIWTVFTLLALGNLGVNITALVAGLGVGGIAIALAVQTILGDLLGSISIALDKPFAVGDALRIDDIEGTVEHIGIKSTRLRSVNGEQIIVANADVLKSRVRNLGRMPEKRVVTRLRVAYETPHQAIEMVPVLVQRSVQAVAGTRFVSCLLMEIGEYALEFELVYFIANRDGLVASATDAVNRGILARFTESGIGFAYPTRRQLG